MKGYSIICNKCSTASPITAFSAETAAQATRLYGWKVDENYKAKCPECIKNKGR